MSEVDTTSGEQIPDGAIRHIYEDQTRIVKMAVLPGGKEVLCAGSDLALRVFSLTTGECLYTLLGQEEQVLSIAVLGEDEFVTSSVSGVLRVWRISHQHLLQTMSVGNGSSFAMASLGGGHLVISNKFGRIYEMVWDGVLLAVSGREFTTTDTAEFNVISAIVVYKNRFITSSQTGAVEVWNNSPFRVLATIETPTEDAEDQNETPTSGPPTAMAINDRWISVWTPGEFTVRIYDAATYELRRIVKRERNRNRGTSSWSRSRSTQNIQELVFTSDNENLIEIADDGIVIYNVNNGHVVWSRFSTLFGCSLLPGGRILASQQVTMVYYKSRNSSRDVSFNVDRLTVLYPMPEVAAMITTSLDVFDVVPMETEPAAPLQDALASIFSARSDATRRCHELVRADLCSKSIAEWNCAHQILMLAVWEGSIPRSEDYQGKKQWWLYQLYLTACHFTITTKEDENIVRHCLREASQLSIIRSEKVVLDMLKSADDIVSTPGIVHSSLVRIYNGLIYKEGPVTTLKRTYGVYKQTKRASFAAAIALQLIWHFGVSLEGTFSAEEVSDNSEADTPTRSKTSSTDDAERQTYFVNCLLLRLSSVLSDDEGSQPKVTGGQRAEKLLRPCGLDIETLRNEFGNADTGTDEESSSEICVHKAPRTTM